MWFAVESPADDQKRRLLLTFFYIGVGSGNGNDPGNKLPLLAFGISSDTGIIVDRLQN